MFWFLFFGLLTATNGILNSQNRAVVLTKARAESDYFLPDTLQPISYEITIIPTFLDTTRDPRFDGSMRMTFSPKISGVSSIILHVGTGLGVSQSTLRISSAEGEQLQITSIEIDNEVQMMTIFTNIELQVDKQYVLTAEFNGIVTIAGYGLFRGSYQEPNSNTTSYYLGTQLRPVYARQLFPCLDEPKYKARFTLTVLRPQDYVARSNMPLAAISPPDANGLVAIEFQQTPVMSPYLLTLFVFQFASEASLRDTNFFARYVGWSVPSKISQMRWSQQICPPLVDIAENYFNVPLYVPKMDQIALPQLVTIAMENWGINTYREINILADERSSMRQRQTVGRFTGHEVLHHWIGDLVTLEWWDYLWLQEAFAMYFEYFFPNVMDPSWRMMDQFIVDLTVEGLHGDNADSPLTSRVVTPQEVTNKFMGLTYTKGPALIRMLQHLMGEQNYQNGLKRFVSERRFLTMTPEQLWNTLQLFTPNINLNDLMSTWTDQGNFPVLFVFRDEKRNKLVIQQNDIDDYSKNRGYMKKTKLWQIPVSYTTKIERNFENTTPKFIMDKPISEFQLDTIVPCTDWIIFNLQFSGYYRVLYDHDNTQLLVTQLHENHELIHPLNRAQLIDDSFVFAEKRIIQYNSAFSLVSYLYKEREYVPLRVALRAFNQLDQRLQTTSLYEVFRGFLNATLTDPYLSIGFDDKFGEEPLQKLNREQMVQWSCYYDVADCRANALATFKRLQSTNSLNRLPGDTRPTIICYAAKSGDQQILQNYIAPLYLSTDNSEINEAVNALACSDETSLGQILELPIPNNRWITLFGAILSRTENVYYGLNYLTSNLDKVVQRIGVTETANLIKQLQSKISLQGVTQRVMKNLRKNKMSNQQELQTPINDLLNSIKVNDMWLKERYNDLKVTLFSYYAPPEWRNIPATLNENHNFVRAVPVQYSYQPEEYLIQ